MNAVGGNTYMGLGHNGFTDIRLLDDGSAILTRAEASPLDHGIALKQGERFRATTYTTPASYSARTPVDVLFKEAAAVADADLDLQGTTFGLQNEEAKLDEVVAKWNSAMLPRDEAVAANSDKAGISSNVVASAVALGYSSGSTLQSTAGYTAHLLFTHTCGECLRPMLTLRLVPLSSGTPATWQQIALEERISTSFLPR
jgi:hypothetical protein